MAPTEFRRDTENLTALWTLRVLLGGRVLENLLGREGEIGHNLAKAVGMPRLALKKEPLICKALEARLREGFGTLGFTRATPRRAP